MAARLQEEMIHDVIVIGAGAAGLMAAATAAARGRRVLVLERSHKIGEKIRISGGGRCNFTNLDVSSLNYLSENPHFVKSALSAYGPRDFMALLDSQGIVYYEKTLGQLFCRDSAQQIIDLLVQECRRYGADILTGCSVFDIQRVDAFYLTTSLGVKKSQQLILATGGLSVPKLGATDFSYRWAQRFGLTVIPPRPALVPLLVASDESEYTALSGMSCAVRVNHGRMAFEEKMLLTHRGLSGPAILQISSYLRPTQESCIQVDCLPHQKVSDLLQEHQHSKQTVAALMRHYLPQRWVAKHLPEALGAKRLMDLNQADRQTIHRSFHNISIAIAGDEGYKKAEVTAGGVDTREISSKTMQSHKVPGLFFIGEALDVTGWLGGYNFQWAWSSGVAAGRSV
jgi:predicted Rossmann fold flavoprotein